MELTIGISILIFLGAVTCGFINSASGMLYGTILSSVLLILGFNPLLVIPSILFSQGVGALTASIFHHRLKNADFAFKSTNPRHIIKRLSELGYKEGFRRGMSDDLKVSIFVASLGILATVFAAFIAINIPKIILKTYIGILVSTMGIILLSRMKFKFSWKKMVGLGILSSFNKSLSGGGFGPVLTAGQIIGGRNGKNSVGATLLVEITICFSGFLVYFLTKNILSWNLIILLSSGAFLGSIIGPFFTAKFQSESKLRSVLGILVVGLGIWVLISAWFIRIQQIGN
jgi:hypothetical protein